MKPDCFRSYTTDRHAPCGACSLRGPCSTKTVVTGFGFLHYPRLLPRDVVAYDTPSTADAKVAQELLKMCSDAGMKVKGDAVRGQDVNGKWPVIAVVASMPGGLVEVRFPDIHLMRVASMPAAARCDVRPLTVKSKTPTKGATLRHIRKQAQLAEVGSRAICSTSRDALAMIVDVHSRVYRESDAHVW